MFRISDNTHIQRHKMYVWCGFSNCQLHSTERNTIFLVRRKYWKNWRSASLALCFSPHTDTLPLLLQIYGERGEKLPQAFTTPGLLGQTAPNGGGYPVGLPAIGPLFVGSSHLGGFSTKSMQLISVSVHPCSLWISDYAPTKCSIDHHVYLL